MKIPTGSVRLSLVEAATRQTEAAIEALERGQFDVALTLAGAAEGMIPRDGFHMFAALKAGKPDIDGVTGKQWIAVLNLERDWLKHGGQETMKIECGHAAFMIARAASKLEVWTPKMDQFKVWLIANIDAISDIPA
jgi:hypothetical protein